MTIRKAVSTIQRLLIPSLYEMGKEDIAFAKEVDEAWKVVREIALKTENSLFDEGTTTAWMNMPESPNDDYGERFKRNVDESLNELNHRTVQCETEIEMLWDAVEAIKNRLPKEWGR